MNSKIEKKRQKREQLQSAREKKKIKSFTGEDPSHTLSARDDVVGSQPCCSSFVFVDNEPEDVGLFDSYDSHFDLTDSWSVEPESREEVSGLVVFPGGYNEQSAEGCSSAKISLKCEELKKENASLRAKIKILEQKMGGVSMFSKASKVSPKKTSESLYPLANQLKLKSPLHFLRCLENPSWASFSTLRNYRTIENRMKSVVSFSQYVANEEDIRQFWKELGKYASRKGLAEDISIMDIIKLKSRLKLSYSEVAVLKSSLKDTNTMIPSIQRIREFELLFTSELLYGIEADKLQSSRSMSNVKFACNDVQSIVNNRARAMLASKKIDSSDAPFKITVLGDKGAGTTKLGFSVMHGEKTNSPDNLTLLGVYTGDDKQSLLKENLGNVLEQLNNLQKVHIRDEHGRVIEKNVEIYLTGDYMFLCECLGHGGPGTKEPCIFCYQEKRGNSSHLTLGELNMGSTPRARTVGSYARDARREEFSVVAGEEVLFRNIPITKIIPPSLHIVMGVFDKYVIHPLFQYALRLDCLTEEEFMACNSTTESKKRKLIEGLKQKYQEHENYLTLIEKEEDDVKNIKRAWDMKADSNSANEDHDYAYCGALHCIITCMQRSGYKNDIDLCKCSQCEQKMHMECCGIITIEQRAADEHFPERTICYSLP
uniref:Uncharacterized protein n=1 Tax=Caenorhabditis japonica TaxID=281687 RepID=A0A8R1IGP4_CAEJA